MTEPSPSQTPSVPADARAAGRWRRLWPILVLLALGLFWSPLSASWNQCVARCNDQYLKTVKHCDLQLAKSGRKDWHADCKKNAEIFRRGCISHCR